MTIVTVLFQVVGYATAADSRDVRVGTAAVKRPLESERFTMVITDTISKLDATHHRVTLVPSGEIDAGNVESLAESLHDALLSGAYEIDLDLSEVPFLDTAALDALRAARDSLDAVGGHLCIRNPTPPVRRLLSLTAFTPSCSVPHG